MPVSRLRNLDTRRIRLNEHWALFTAAVSACNLHRIPACVGEFDGRSWDHDSARHLLQSLNMFKTEHRLCTFGIHLKPDSTNQSPSSVAYCLYHNSATISHTPCRCGTNVEHRFEHMFASLPGEAEDMDYNIMQLLQQLVFDTLLNLHIPRLRCLGSRWYRPRVYQSTKVRIWILIWML